MNRIPNGKQMPVSLPDICAARTDLMLIFDQAAQKSQCLYIQAPAGYGKTISTLLWLKKNSYQAAWMTLDAYDNVLVLFYRFLCNSILPMAANASTILNDAQSPAFNASPVESTIDLLSQLSFENSRYILVLDDFHMIINEEIIKSLPFVINRLPVSFTTVILSRDNLPDAVSGLEKNPKVSFIGSSELAFSSEEIRKHFSSYGRFITKEQSEQIKAHTEGWIMALNTMAISGNLDISDYTRPCSINHFIETNIWRSLDPALKDFLTKTALPDIFSLELCQDLTGNDHCKETLDHLIRGNINISRVGTEYRYHNLFLEFLREKLNQSSLDIKALNKITASYYMKHGDILKAKNFAMKSGDASLISLALRSFYELKTFSLDEYIEFHTQYKLYDLPDAVCEKMPLLYPARIFFFYVNGNICETGRLFDKLYHYLPVISSAFPDSLENIRSMLVLDCRYPLSDLSSLAAGFPPDTVSHTNLQAPTFSFQLPFCHRSARDYYQLTDQKIAHYVRMFSVNILKQNLSLMFDGVQAGLLMERNRLSEALETVLPLKKSTDSSMSPEFVFSVYVMTAQLYLLMNQREKCDETLEDIKKYITTSSCQYLLKNLSAFEAGIALLDGNIKAARKWLENYYVNDDSFTQFYKLYRNFVTARAYIVLFQTDKAYSALSKLKALAASYDRPLDKAEADVLLSITDWICGNKKEAQFRLLQVLSAMQPFGFIRIIANEGKAVLPILSAVIKKMERGSGTSEALLGFTREVYFTAHEQSRIFKGLTHHAEPMAVKLSPRQKRVLELLAQGHKNAEIIEITGLSLNTIRTHTRVIYQKLEVNNATDAVVKARQLGILN